MKYGLVVVLALLCASGPILGSGVDSDGDGVIDSLDVCAWNASITIANPFQVSAASVADFALFDGDRTAGVVRDTGAGWVVELVDLQTGNATELFSVPTEPSAGLSQDESRVVFLGDWQTPGVTELFSVPVTGGSPVRLNGNLPAGGAVLDFWISWDSQAVVYRADQDQQGIAELYRVPIDGGASTKINHALGSGEQIESPSGQSPYAIARDSQTVVYISGSSGTGRYELRSVAMSGTPQPVLLNVPLGPSGRVDQFVLDGVSSRVVYSADVNGTGPIEIYSASLAGGASPKLNGSIVPGGGVFFFLVTPGGADTVYAAFQDTLAALQIYSVPTAGGPVTTLTPAHGPGGLYTALWATASPTGTRVVYQLAQDGSSPTHLYSVPVSGGSIVQLSDPMTSGGNVIGSIGDAQGNSVAYLADQNVDESFELFAVPADGSLSPVRLNGSLAPGSQVFVDSFGFTPSGQSVVYASDESLFLDVAVWAAATDGSGSTRLTIPHGSGVPDYYDFSETGEVLLYRVAGEAYAAVLPLDAEGDGFDAFCDVCDEQFDPGQIDADGDGIGDLCDCAVNDPANPPPAPLGPTLTAGRTGSTIELSWTASGGTDGAHLFRGTVDSLDTGIDQAECIEIVTGGSTAQDATAVQPGESLYYLVAPFDGCGVAELGSDSQGQSRGNPDPTCSAAP